MNQKPANSEETIPGAFLGVDSPLETSRVVILPVPYEGTVSYQPGTRYGPGAIIEASAHVELYDQELDAEPFEIGIHTVQPIWPDFRGPEQMSKKIFQICRRHLGQDKSLVLLGGEHSVTVGAVRAHLERHADMSVLQLDAHADLRDQYHGTKWGHASTMRRIEELCPTVGIGVRSLSREEMEFARAHDLQILFAHQIHKQQDWISRTVDHLTDKVYVTIDLDVLDPGIMPAVGTPVPGGLSWHQVLNLLRQVANDKRVVGFDVVELSPIPGQVAPDFLAAKLIYKFIGYVFGERIEIES